MNSSTLFFFACTQKYALCPLSLTYSDILCRKSVKVPLFYNMPLCHAKILPANAHHFVLLFLFVSFGGLGGCRLEFGGQGLGVGGWSNSHFVTSEHLVTALLFYHQVWPSLCLFRQDISTFVILHSRLGSLTLWRYVSTFQQVFFFSLSVFNSKAGPLNGDWNI